jgi:hypothetical protein
VITIRVPTSETMLELHGITELDVETSIEACVQLVSRKALRHVLHDAREYLKDGPYHLRP